MKNILYIIIVLSLVACGKVRPEGKIVSQDTPLEDFTAIALKGKFRVFFAAGTKSFVNVETYPNVAENLRIKVKDKTLTIEENRETKGVDFYNITIYSRYQPTKIFIADSVEFNVSSEINTDNFRLNLKNNGKFIGAIRSRSAEIEMAQLSLANFRGFSKNAVIKLKDTANIVAPYWRIDHVQLELKNGVFAEISVQDSLKGKIEDTGKLLYHGDPIRAIKIGKTTNVQNKALE